MKTLENKRANKIIKTISCLKDECIRRHVINMRPYLDQICVSVQSPMAKITHKRYALIKNSLNWIGKNLDTSHENSIKHECDKASNIATGRYVAPTKEEELIMKNYSDVYDLEKIIKDVDSQIESNKSKMDECLGKDPTQWKMLNAMNVGLRQKKALYEKQFNDSLAFCQNLDACNNVKTIRSKFTNNIIKNQTNVDLVGFERDLDTINCLEDEIKEQNSFISERIYDSYSSNLDDEYAKALAEKMNNPNAEEESNNCVSNVQKDLKISNI